MRRAIRTDITVVNSNLGACARDAIRMASNLGRDDPGVVDTVTGPNSHGLMIQGGGANDDMTSRSNLFRDIGSIGILLGGATDVRLYANAFARAGGTDTVEWKAGATGTIDSAVVYDAAGAVPQPWCQDATSRPSHGYNLAWGGRLLSDEASGLNADPRFRHPDGTLDAGRDDDFQISDPGSPAIDRGNPAITGRSDILGRPIFNFRVDEGALEHAPD
jgi:hypothetical protein